MNASLFLDQTKNRCRMWLKKRTNAVPSPGKVLWYRRDIAWAARASGLLSRVSGWGDRGVCGEDVSGDGDGGVEGSLTFCAQMS